MAAGGKNRVNVEVGFIVDKSGLAQMQSLFQQIANKANEPGASLDKGLQKAASTAATLDKILEKTFNTELGTLNVAKFNQELSKSGMTIKSIKNDLSGAGSQGASAYNRMTQAILGTNLQLKESSKLLDSMATTMANTVRWGITSSIFNAITTSISNAYTYAKKLDTSLNDIRIVTDKSADSMDRFAEKANEAAKNLGASTLDYTNASLIYYQQGLSDEEAQARAETTVKAANVTGQTGREVSEQLTAVWNGYKVTAEETELYVDKLAAVAATTASNLEELSTGMSKVASAANSMGVNVDQLNAQLSTIISVTRQAPETAGNALKTIYARLGDLKIDGEDEFGVKLGEVSSQMDAMGISILDQMGNIRDMGEVIEEVAAKWNTWTEAQRQAVAIAMAGKRQYNNLIALFDNWDKYTAALETSSNAMGTLQHQQDIYMESTAAKLKTLKSEWQDVYGDLINKDELDAGIEGLTNLVDLLDKFIESFGGGIKSIMAFGAIVANIFNKQIATGINNAIQNYNKYKENLDLLQLKKQQFQEGTKSTGDTNRDQAIAVGADKELQIAKQIYDVRAGLTTEEYNNLTTMQQQVSQLAEEQKYIELQTIDREKSIIDEQVITDLLTKEITEVEKIKDATFEEQQAQENIVVKEEEKVTAIENQIKKALAYNAAEKSLDGHKLNILNRAKAIGDEEGKAVQKILKNVHSTSDLRRLKDYIIEASSKQLNKENEALDKINKQVDAEERVLQERNKIAESKEKEINLQNQLNAGIEKGEKGRDITQTVTTITSGLSTMAMAWSSVSSLIKTINDDSISFGDKLTQSVVTLGMTIPMILSSFTKLKEAFGATSTIMDVLNTKQALKIALDNKEVAASASRIALFKLFNATKKEEVAQAMELITAKELDLVATNKNNAGLVAHNINKRFGNKLDKNQISALKALIIERIADTEATVAEKEANDALNASLLASPVFWVVAGLAAVAATIAIVVKAVDSYYKKEAELAEQTIKDNQARQEEIKQNQELAKTYQELYNTWKETGERKQELYEQTLKIAEAYGIEGAALLALSDKYDYVNKKILEKQRDELIEDIRLTEESAMNAAITTSQDIAKGKGQKAFKNGKYEYELGGGYNSANSKEYSEDAKIFKKAIEAAGLEASADFKGGENNLKKGYKIKISFDYDDPEGMLEWKNQVDSMVNYLEATLGKEAKTKDFYKQLKEEQRQFQNSETFETLSKFNDINEKRVKEVFMNYQLNNNELLNSETSLEKILEISNKIRENFEGKISTEELDVYINNYLSSVEGLSEKVSKINLIEDIISRTKNENKDENILRKEVTDIIEDLNNSQLGYLQLHLDELTLNNDLEDWVNSKNDEFAYIGTLGIQQTIEDLISNFDEKKGFESDPVNAIYNNLGIEAGQTVTGMSADSFAIQSEADQLNILTQAWIEQTKTIVEKRDEITKKLEDEQVEIRREIAIYEESYQKADQQVSNVIKNSDVLKDKENEVKKALIELANSIDGKVNPAYQGYIDVFKEESGLTDAELKGIGYSIDLHEKQIDTLDILNSTLDAVANAQLNHNQAVEKFRQVSSMYSAELDNIQSAYSSLISIVDDYNESHMFTVDTVQQLMAMDDTYVASLQFENGQLVLNEEAIQNLTIAKIDDMEQTAVLTAQQELEALAENNAKNAALDLTSATLNAAAAARDASDAAREGAAAWDEYAASMRAAAGVSGAEYDAKSKEITDALRNRLLAAEDAKKNVRKGGASMRKAMGAGKKGGGGKDKKEKEGKNYEDEFDRYWEIKKAIDAVDKALNRLQKDQKNYYGYQLIDSLKKQNALLDQQAANYNKLLEAQQAEAAELRNQLGTMGVMFDASGAIINYAEATAQALAAYNAAIQQYNAGLIDETTLGVAEKAYENFKKLLDRYDKLYYDEIKQTEEKLDDIRREKLANNLKAWEVEIEFKLNFKELKREWNDFLAEINEDFKKVYKDITAEMKKFSKNAKTYIGEDGSIGVTLKAIEDVKREIDKMMAGGTSDMFESVSQAQEKLKELNETLLKDAKVLHDLWKAAWEAYLEGIEQVADKFDDLMDQFEKINDELNFQKELIELIYGEEAYGLMDKLYKGQEKSLENQIGAVKTEADMWKQLWKESGATMENQADWNEDQKKYYEQWIAAQEKLNDLTLDYIKLLKEDYSNTIKSILKDLETSLTGSSLNDIKDQWERISAYSDKYLDDVEKAYETQKLANKIDQSITSTSNLKNQQKLQALREKEIGYLREKEHLTQYDLDAAEARYQIALKEMALEDAKNNKTSMKLVRNEQGNWSYQYMADEEDVQSKQQDLLDAYSKLYQLASDAYEENLNASIELEEEYNERLQEIAELRLTNEDEYNKKLAEIDAWYLEQRKSLAEENTLYRQDLETSAAAIILGVYQADHESIKGMTEEQKELLDELINGQVIPDYMELERLIKEEGNPAIAKSSEEMMESVRRDWSSSAQLLADLWNADDGKSVKAQVKKAYEAIQKATEEYKAKVDWCADAVGRDFGPDGITGAIDKAANATDNLKDRTEELANDSARYLETLKNYVNSLEDAWNSVKGAIEDAIAAIEEYIQKRALANEYDGANPGNIGGGQNGTTPGSGGTGDGNGGTPSSPGSGGNNYKNYFVEYWPIDCEYYDDRGFKSKDPTKVRRINDLDLTTAQSKLQGLLNTGKYHGNVSHYDTGGYTGEWGNDGRLALLHQKELVLNKDDTANFLEGINTLRDMTSTNGSITNAIAKAVSNMAYTLGSLKSPTVSGGVINNNENATDNNIFNISAEFPNASNVNDIREALMSLPNLASQYVARNRK